MTTIKTRREFMTLLGGAAATSLFEPMTALAADAAVSSQAAALYNDSLVIDGNVLASVGQGLIKAPQSELDAFVKLMRETGMTAVKSTLGGAAGTFEETVADIAAAEYLIERRPDALLKIRTYADLVGARQHRKFGIIYSFEAASMLEDKLERIELFHQLGVRVMQLTYNRRSPFGVGCLDGDDEGLTGLGRQAVAKMNEIGVAIDLSHSNRHTTADGIAASKKPVLITHAGCREIYRHPRHKEDRDMRALADKGGVMGIYMLPFLSAPPKQPTLDDFLQHLTHALKICGEEHVGVGSDALVRATEKDFEEMRKEVETRKAQGVSAPGEDERPVYIAELNTPRKMETIADALLKRGYSARAAEKVLGENFRRVFKETWTA